MADIPSYNNVLRRYLEEVLLINKQINLTSISDFNTAWILHIQDSLSALEEVDKCHAGMMVDLGSGGGFPGVPLGVASGRETVLIDSTKKKMSAVETILNKLDLNNITTFSGRIEEYHFSGSDRFSVALTRGLGRLPSLIELAAPLLEIGGRLVCFKSQQVEDEIVQAGELLDLIGFQLISKRDFILAGDRKRRIIVYEKTMEPKIKLPRKIGLSQKRYRRKYD